MGKDWAGPFFPPPPPPPLIFWSSIDRFVFRFMLLFHSILTFMKDLYQSENQVFNPTRLLVLLHCWVGKEWAGPFFPPPPPPPPPPLCLDLSIYCLVFQFMLLFDCIWTILNDLFQREIKFLNQQVNWYFYIVGWGKTGSAHSFPTPKCWDLSIYPLDFWIMLLFCCIWTLLTYTKQRIKFSNQHIYL